MLQPKKNVSGIIGGQAIFSPHWNQMWLCNKYRKNSRYGAKALCYDDFSSSG